MLRSSQMNLPPSLDAQDRIIEIARAVGANHYVNAPGGRALYETDAFERAGLKLHFLSDYSGPYTSMLERMLREPAAVITEEVRNETHLMRE